MSGRRFAPTLDARLTMNGAIVELRAPRPAEWRDAPAMGSLITPGGLLGKLEVLGVLYELIAPAEARGLVVGLLDGPARRPVEAGAILLRLDPEGIVSGGVSQKNAVSAESSGPVFRAPLGGRYYARPTPTADAFVKSGDVLSGGETVALIEVMKTFNRVQIAGVKLPAKVTRVVPKDGDDIEAGAVLLELAD